HLNGPTLVLIGWVIERSINMHRGLNRLEIPVNLPIPPIRERKFPGSISDKISSIDSFPNANNPTKCHSCDSENSCA
ncbi:MAG: hypothetical protein ACOYOZ_17555, partial [Pirellula sp.]